MSGTAFPVLVRFLGPEPSRQRINFVSGLQFSQGQDVSRTSGGGKAGMADYRAYTVGQDGHFINFRAFSCDDDPDAIERARLLVDGRAVELWCGPRFVIRLDGKPE